MRRKAKFIILAAYAAASVAFSSVPLVVLAQEEAGPREVEVPNPMGIHTWFIIVAVGAFLAWCISYILDLQKEKVVPKPKRDALLQRKNELLDRIAELEAQKEEPSTLPEPRYEKEYKKARNQLSDVLSRLSRGQSAVEE